MSTKPNILFLIVDELRYPVDYESNHLKRWREKNLKFYNMLSENGTVFHRHYTNTNACVPARVTLQTGQYPSVHGCTQTDGLAKEPDDPEMTWFAKNKVPTIGNYLSEAGYSCHLRGKWHLSIADITGESGDPILTYDAYGNRIKETEKIYKEQNVLRDYGYNGWIGPEPHGAFSLNSGSSLPKPKIGRDEKFVQQTIELLDELDNEKDPWYACINLVDPHDITLYGSYFEKVTTSFEFELDPNLPDALFSQHSKRTFNEDLKNKPSCQRDYKNKYHIAVQPILNTLTYMKYYYTLMKRVDDQLLKIWNKLKSLDCYDNTIIVFTSDHGDLLASHGGLFQKWYQAYEEAIHVPLIISSPLYGNKHQDIYDLTSHIDILPTFLDMCKVNKSKIDRKLKCKFKNIFPHHGSSLVPFIKSGNISLNRPVYFYTEDNALKGKNQVNPFGGTYEHPTDPCLVEAIIVYVDGKLWKFTNYYYYTVLLTPLNAVLKNELYNITDDPMELNNMYNTVDPHIKSYFNNLLYEYSIKCNKIRNMI